MAETVNVSEMANYISSDIFEFFKWERVSLKDLNFKCEIPNQHGGEDKEKYTHPVDIVFHYIDPYTNKKVFLNTDLKSYKATSINSGPIRTAITSLANTIDCAAMSEEWKRKYDPENEANFEIRGLLFVYNHDSEFDRDFYDFFERGSKEEKKDKRRKYINPLSLGVQKNQYVHIMDPGLIEYLVNIVSDVKNLKGEGKFPMKDYAFYYPDQTIHKVKNDNYERPATIEMLAGPYIIIKHSSVKVYNEEKKIHEEIYPQGYLIYLRGKGNDHKDFMYLFDQISNYQMLEGEHRIRVKMPCDASENSRSNFRRAIESYSSAWGYDKYKKKRLEEIELSFLGSYKPAIFEIELAREVD